METSYERNLRAFIDARNNLSAAYRLEQEAFVALCANPDSFGALSRYRAARENLMTRSAATASAWEKVVE